MDKLRFLVVMLAAVVALSVGEALIARGLRPQSPGPQGFRSAVRSAVTDVWVISGVSLLIVHLALYAAALSSADLSLVMPLTAASYPLGVLLAHVFLHETVNPSRWVGTLVITLGVALVAWGEV